MVSTGFQRTTMVRSKNHIYIRKKYRMVFSEISIQIYLIKRIFSACGADHFDQVNRNFILYIHVFSTYICSQLPWQSAHSHETDSC